MSQANFSAGGPLYQPGSIEFYTEYSPASASVPTPIVDLLVSETGLSAQWVSRAECSGLVQQIKTLQGLGWSAEQILASPAIRQDISIQEYAMQEHENLNFVENNARMVLSKNIDEIDWDDIPHLDQVMQAIPALADNDWKAAMVVAAYKGHQRLSAVEAQQSENSAAIREMAAKQTQLEAMVAETRAIATRTEALFLKEAVQQAEFNVAKARQEDADAKAALTVIQKSFYVRQYLKTQEIKEAQAVADACARNLRNAERSLAEAAKALENANHAAQVNLDVTPVTVLVDQATFSSFV